MQKSTKSDCLPDHLGPTQRTKFRSGRGGFHTCCCSMFPDGPRNWEQGANWGLRVGLGWFGGWAMTKVPPRQRMH
eukprot:4203070-Pyramimonas_sp.AAC.1